MPLPVGLLKTVLALEELHDFFTREFTTGGEAHNMYFLLKRRLHKRLRHVKEERANLSRSQSQLSFSQALMRAWGMLSLDSLHPGLE